MRMIRTPSTHPAPRAAARRGQDLNIRAAWSPVGSLLTTTMMMALVACSAPAPEAQPKPAADSATAPPAAAPTAAAKSLALAAAAPPSCTAPATWFPSTQTPEPDPNVDFNSFCAFHQWAWQSMLWLTQLDDSGRMRFESFPTAAEVISGQGSDTPGAALQLRPRTSKTDRAADSLDEINQAGQGGILVDHQGRAIYYSQHVNQAMFNDIESQGWNLPSVLNSMPATVEFKTGDVELKAAWKIVSPGEDVSELIVRDGVVDTLVNRDGSITTDPTRPLQVKVAFVGFHIVGWVKGHPEAIWATFEYRRNAPDYAPEQSTDKPVSSEGFLFYTANTKAIDCNQLNSAVLKLDEATQTLSPVTQVCRQFPFGMVAGTTDKGNDLPNLAAITELNASVRQQLETGSLLKNYFEVGAEWTTGVIVPNSTLQDTLVGSRLLGNAVIETFNQQVQSQNNCFSCHNTMMFNPPDPKIPPMQGTNISLSHIILRAFLDNQGK
jgi:hypothetical protein